MNTFKKSLGVDALVELAITAVLTIILAPPSVLQGRAGLRLAELRELERYVFIHRRRNRDVYHR